MLSLQQRVLEVLGKQELVPAKTIGGFFPDVERVALDCCLNALLRANAVILACGNYSAVRPPCAESDEIHVTAPVVKAPAVRIPAPTPLTRRCRECREPKPLTDYPELGPQKRRGKTCNACREALVEKKQQTIVVADKVFENVQAKRQEALNKIAVLKVDVANLEAVVGECDQFIELYGRFSDEWSGQR